MRNAEVDSTFTAPLTPNRFMVMTTVSSQLQALDSLISQGKILESLPEFFADNCTFTEVGSGESRNSLAAQNDHLSSFFSTLQGFNGATLHSSAINGDTSLSEWTFDMIAGDGSSIVWNEILVRRWAEGKVIEEKYYNANA